MSRLNSRSVAPERLDAERRRIEEDFAARMKALFERCPALYGFTIPDHSEPMPSNVAICPLLGPAQCDEICYEIAAALLAFLSERPAAEEMLRGRTVARTLH